MTGIYKITNLVTGKMYIGSTTNYTKRCENHMSLLRTGKHKNTALQEDVIEYGLKNFKFEMIQEYQNISTDDLKRREMLEIEYRGLENLYNKVIDTFGGGAEVNCKETYLLDLNGNILRVFDSTIECFKYLGYSVPDYTYLNTPTKRKKIYRIVTKEFYDSNINEIKSWCNESTYEYQTRLKRLKQLKKVIYVTDNTTGYKTEYKNMANAARAIGVSPETVRLALKDGRSLVGGRYTLSKHSSLES